MARSRALASVLNLVDVEESLVEQAFLTSLETSIVKEDMKARAEHKPSLTVKPSGMKCTRFMVFGLLGTEQHNSDVTPTLVGICESGTDRHERIQNAIMAMPDCEYIDVGTYVKEHNLADLEIRDKKGNETHLYHRRLNISFLTDGIIKYKGKYYILEIKTESSNKYFAHNDTRDEHKYQGTAYSLCFGIDDVIFLYENRDICSKKAFMFHVTDEMRKSLEDRILYTLDCARNNCIPPKESHITKGDCSWCGYKETCERYV